MTSDSSNSSCGVSEVMGVPQIIFKLLDQTIVLKPLGTWIHHFRNPIPYPTVGVQNGIQFWSKILFPKKSASLGQSRRAEHGLAAQRRAPSGAWFDFSRIRGTNESPGATNRVHWIMNGL